MKRVITIVLGVVFGVPAGVLLGFWSADDDAPVVISRIEIVTPEVAPGGNLHVKYHIYRLRNDCTYVAQRTFTGTDRIIRPILLESQRQGHLLGAVPPEERSMRIPISMPPGPADYAVTLEFQCGTNPLHGFRPIIIGPVTATFNVAGAPVVVPEPEF